MTRSLVLLPPSKGKAEGGDGTPFARSLAGRHPLREPRIEVLDAAVAAAARLDDAGIARICGARVAHVAAARTSLAALRDAPTLPAHRRYTGVVHGNAGLASCDPGSTAVEVRIVSALLGLVALEEPVPGYRLEFAATLPPLGGLATFWRESMRAHLAEVGADRRVWDLLPGEHARMWSRAGREALDVVTVRFVRPDGRPANAARTKVAKGRLTAWLLSAPDAGPQDAAQHAELGEAWSLEADGVTLTATLQV